MADSLDIIKKLREQTELSIADIKNALQEANGDEAKALELLKVRGGQIVEKKEKREIKSGIIESYVHGNKKIGVLLELGCETDFVARNPEFQSLAHELAMHIVAMEPEDENSLLDQPFVKDPQITIKDLINSSIAKLGENIKVRRFARLEI